jgi:hypothetical protein
VVVLVVWVVVLLLLLVRCSAATVEWWRSVSCGVVACVDDCWCGVVDGVCIVVCNVGVVHVGIGGGGLDVGIWIGACWGSGGVVSGGGNVFVVVGEVVCGGGGGVVVFCLHFQLPSVSPNQFGLAFVPALSCFPSTNPSLLGL